MGQGSSNILIASSAILCSIFFFYIFILGSDLKIPVYPIDNRLTNNTYFTDTYLISRNIDHMFILSATLLWLVLSIKGYVRIVTSAIYAALCIYASVSVVPIFIDIVALMSVPLIMFLLTYDKVSTRKILNVQNELTANYFAITCTAIGLLSIVMSLLLVSSYRPMTVMTRDYAYMIYLLASSSSTFIMFLLIFCLPLKLLVNEFEKMVSKFRRGVSATPTHKLTLTLKTKVFYISLIGILSIILVIIPHQQALNNGNHYIGSDTQDYISFLTGSKNSSNVEHFFQRSFDENIQGDRPLSLVFLYILAKISPWDLGHTLDYVPIILAPLLVLVIYFLTREMTSNDVTAVLASFITAVSFHTLVGIYAGFYANWFALIIGFLSFVLMLRYLKIGNKRDLVLYGISVVLLLFAHVYTWSVLTLVAGIFLLIMLKSKYYSKRRAILLLLVALSSVAIDFARSPNIASHTGIASDIRFANVFKVGVTQFFFRWDNLDDSVHGYFGAMFGNFIILILGLYWVLGSNFRQPSNIFLAIFFSIAIIPVSVGDWVIQTRVLYEIPFQIPAAVAMTKIKARANGTGILVPLCIWLIAISIITVINF